MSNNIKKHTVIKNVQVNKKNEIQDEDKIELQQNINIKLDNEAIISNNISTWTKFKHIIYTLNYALSKRRYISIFLFLSFPLFILLLIYIIPYQPSIPAISALQQVNGKFDYIVENKHKYGTYTIDGVDFNCGQILRSYPFDNCPITMEIKTFKGQDVQAKWYKQKVGFTYKPVLVEMIFDSDIQIMGVNDTQKMMMKLHKKNQQFFIVLVPLMFIVYFLILFSCLIYLYKVEQKSMKIDK